MLDELVKTIETLKERISEHRTVLQGSEAQTRMSLIDPLLRALGWETADPTLVRPEFVLSTGRADYALLGPDQKPAAIIEAKRLDEPLGTTDRHMQMLTYAVASNVDNAVLTDGNQWVMYRVFERQEDKRRILNISIEREDTAKAALNLLLLWRRNLESGQPIAASEPIVGVEPQEPKTTIVDDTSYFNIRREEESAPPIPDEDEPAIQNAAWILLTNLDAQKGGKCPPKVRFPNEPERNIRNWTGLLTEVAKWLVRIGALTPNRSPVTEHRRSGFCTVNSEPRHLNGINFVRYEPLDNDLFLEVNFSAPDCVKHSKVLVEHCQRDPASVQVQLG